MKLPKILKLKFPKIPAWLGIPVAMGVTWAALSLFFVLVFNLGESPPKSGDVVGKRYEKSYTYYISVNKVPIETVEPPHWYLEIRPDEDTDSITDVEVTELEWRKYDFGSHWPDPQ